MKQGFTGGLLAFLIGIALPAASQAGVIVQLQESGSDVVATISGSITTLPTSTGNIGVTSGNRVRGSSGFFSMSPGGAGTGPTVNLDRYSTTSSPNLGTGTTLIGASSGTNLSTNLVVQLGNTMYLDPSYVLGTAITGTQTYANTTLNSMGLAQGSYSWNWAGDSVTVTVVPEPGSLALLGSAACLGLGARAARGRKSLRGRV